MYKLPERRGGGGEVIWAMPERNPFFSCEVFPKQHCDESHSTVGIKFEFSWFHAFMWQRLYLRCTRRHKSLFQITLQDSPFTKCVCTAWYSPICVKLISKSKKETNNIHHSKNKLADYATKKINEGGKVSSSEQSNTAAATVQQFEARYLDI